MSTVVVFVRHGQTHFNLEGRWQGWLDGEGCQLTKQGVAQARALGARWNQEGMAFDAVYSSDLGRAFTTAEIVSEPLGHKGHVKVDKRLREQGFGIFQNRTHEEVRQSHPQAWIRMNMLDPNWRAEGGESMEDVTRRAWAAVLEIVKRNLGKRILVVAHGGTIRYIVRQILSIPWDSVKRFRLKNTSATTIIFDEHGSPTLDCLNDDMHTKML
jgi:broad specificity phosphatase PhoE